VGSVRADTNPTRQRGACTHAATELRGPSLVLALGGAGIALGVVRRLTGAGRGSHDPAGVPDRKVSRVYHRPRSARVSRPRRRV
jgi:hypothetical protein